MLAQNMLLHFLVALLTCLYQVKEKHMYNICPRFCAGKKKEVEINTQKRKKNGKMVKTNMKIRISIITEAATC